MHEASLHTDNAFLTLTYSPENLPSSGSLDKTHWQDFAKRLRHHHGAFRYFHCGEYGERLSRPHYHACLFGIDFDDKQLLQENIHGQKIFHSPSLTEIWGKGFASIGDVTFESAAYVARYITKKITGDAADDHYQGLQPEYVTMSRNKGIAHNWYNQFSPEVTASDEVIARGHPARPPRYYDKLFEAHHGTAALDRVKTKRRRKALAHAADLTPQRLRAREEFTTLKLQHFKRNIENES